MAFESGQELQIRTAGGVLWGRVLHAPAGGDLVVDVARHGVHRFSQAAGKRWDPTGLRKADWPHGQVSIERAPESTPKASPKGGRAGW